MPFWHEEQLVLVPEQPSHPEKQERHGSIPETVELNVPRGQLASQVRFWVKTKALWQEEQVAESRQERQGEVQGSQVAVVEFG